MLGPELSLLVLNAVLLTLLVVPLVMWRYRRAVLAGMRIRSGAVLPAAPPRPLPAPRADASGASGAALDWERRLQRRVFVAVFAVVFICAVPLSALFVVLNELPRTPFHLYPKAGAMATLAVPMAAVLLALPFQRALRLWIVTLLVLAAAGVPLSMLQRLVQGREPSWDQALNFVFFLQLAGVTLWLPLALLLATGAQRVRGVAPIVLAGLLIFALGPLLGMRLTVWLSGTRSGADLVLAGAGLDTGFVLLALPMGLLAWGRLKRLAGAYEAKRFSDAQLLLRTWWLLVVAIEVVDQVNAQPQALWPVLATAGVAFAAFAPLLGIALRRAAALADRPPPRTLLLLRVFGDSARTEALFDRIASRWRWFGPLTMIAAPDVVARTVDPGDLLQFASGRIAASFVNTQDDLDRRLASLDLAPDPDGRYRVNEFCCRDSSWQATVVQLIERADAVVMDLRGFSAQRVGCAFELGELARRARPQQVVLLVDGSTDRTLLDAQLPPGAQPTIVDLPPGRGVAVQSAFVALLRAAA